MNLAKSKKTIAVITSYADIVSVYPCVCVVFVRAKSERNSND